jgi:hypothetical protein
MARVRCMDDGRAWASTADAARDLGVTRSAVQNAIRCRSRCRGYLLRFMEPGEPDGPQPSAPAYPAALNRLRRPVVCRSTGERWESTYHAARALHVAVSAIPHTIRKRCLCKGRRLDYEDGNGTTRRLRETAPAADPVSRDRILSMMAEIRPTKAPGNRHPTVPPKPTREGPLNGDDIREAMVRERRRRARLRTA